MIFSTRRAIEECLGSPLVRETPLSGGDINEAYLLELQDGRRVFTKTHPEAPPGMFQAEAEGLGWLQAAFDPSASERLTIPEVLAVRDDEEARFLVLELLEPGPRRADFDERLGRGLAALHRSGAKSFGFTRDNFIGTLHQSNRPAQSWCDFYRTERLMPQLALPGARSAFSGSNRRRFAYLLDHLDGWLGPPEPPARLHGDLWGGNLHTTSDGQPALIDPAVYGGHREMDLAMMRLFGGFSGRVFSAYEEAFPLAPEHAERTALWQLYPLLVHVNLFGGGYVQQVARILDRYAP